MFGELVWFSIYVQRNIKSGARLEARLSLRRSSDVCRAVEEVDEETCES